MLVNYRPEYHHQWGNRTCYIQLRLDPLGGQSADEMLHALLGGDASLQSLKRLIIDKTEGNPFFMEEIVRALIEQGVLVRNGATTLAKPRTEIRSPPTVHAILASRSQAAARSAYSEAVARLSSALEFLKHLPDDTERARQELSVHSALGSSLSNIKGWAAAELEPVYARAR